jgi:predicted HTH transcriptional regulator
MDDIELREIVFHGREERHIEYKRSINWSNSNVKAKITKSILSMSNIQDGGYLVLGVENTPINPVGMSEIDFDSFNQDDVNAYVAKYADPYANFTLYKREFDKKKFVIINIKEFSEIPVICKKSGLENLVIGEIFTRTRRMYETAKVPSQTELREILDMAINKKLRTFREQLSIAGLLVEQSEDDEFIAKTTKEELDKQLGGL